MSDKEELREEEQIKPWLKPIFKVNSLWKKIDKFE